MKNLLTLLTIIMLAGCGDDCVSPPDTCVDAGGADAAIDAGDVGGDSQ